MTEYEKLFEVPNRHGGKRAVYRLSKPIVNEHGYTSYVCADFAYTFDHGPETMLFACDENGYVTDWEDLWCDYGETVSNDAAIREWTESRNE